MKLRLSKKNILVGSLCVLSTLLSFNANATSPQVIYKDIYNQHQNWKATNMPQAIAKIIRDLETKKTDLYQIVVYKMKDHFLLYQLSNKEWKATKWRIDLDMTGIVKKISASYDGEDNNELEELERQQRPGKCPDESVQFVAISGFPGVGGVNEAIKMVSNTAKQKYKTMTILDKKADGETYRNWLSCSGLKGFYSVGHGANDSIMVGNGDVVSYKFFANSQLINKYKSATIILNSCQVYNYPFGTEVMYGNAEKFSTFVNNPGPNAYEFMGGHTNLLMEDSELSSACFISQAIMGAKMDYDTLKLCVGKRDFNFKNFGLSQPGRLFDSK